jgi:chloramphenicol 3-O-phosphotransferase
MARRFVVISGLPGSGKTTLARQLAPALDLPLIDKDDILERLLDARGAGDSAWRRGLSRESDAILRDEAQASEGAVLVSFRHLPGMPADSGTPTGWLAGFSIPLVNVHCACSPELAAERFLRRKRHRGHLDAGASLPEVLASLRAIECLGPLAIEPRVVVDTEREIRLDAVIREIYAAFRLGGAE